MSDLGGSAIRGWEMGINGNDPNIMLHITHSLPLSMPGKQVVSDGDMLMSLSQP